MYVPPKGEHLNLEAGRCTFKQGKNYINGCNCELVLLTFGSS